MEIEKRGLFQRKRPDKRMSRKPLIRCAFYFHSIICFALVIISLTIKTSLCDYFPSRGNYANERRGSMPLSFLWNCILRDLRIRIPSGLLPKTQTGHLIHNLLTEVINRLWFLSCNLVLTYFEGVLWLHCWDSSKDDQGSQGRKGTELRGKVERH